MKIDLILNGKTKTQHNKLMSFQFGSPSIFYRRYLPSKPLMGVQNEASLRSLHDRP